MYINTQTLQYPVTEREIRALYPNTVFPHSFLAPEPFAWVFNTPAPDHDPIRQGYREAAPALTDKGHWEQQWEVFALDAPQAVENLTRAIDAARTAAHDRINSEYSARTNVLAADYPENEQKSWPVQIQEAGVILSGDIHTATPWITSAAGARGVSRVALAQLIQAQDQIYRQYHGTLTGIRQALRDQIAAVPRSAEAIATLDAIQWPV